MSGPQMSKTLAYPPLTGGESFGYICGLRVINRENNILQWFLIINSNISQLPKNKKSRFGESPNRPKCSATITPLEKPANLDRPQA